jgi:hypothetical protein
MDRPSLDALHADPKNWRWGMFYFSREDPRMLVPKRVAGLGWTVNFARPLTIPFFLVLLGFAWGAVRIAKELGFSGNALLVLKVGLVIAILALCHRMAKHR